MSEVVTYDIKVQPVVSPNTVTVNPVPSFLEGATFTPIITFPSPTKIRFEWTNNRGLPNPEPMEFDIPMGNGDMVKAIYDTNDDGVVDKAENAINSLKINNFEVLRNVLADEYTNEQIDEIINNLPKTTADMEKSVYDTNDNGIVDNAEALMGHSYDEIKNMIDDAYYQRYTTVNYKDTTIHANNSLKRNLVDENTKIEVLGQTIQNLVDDSNIWRTEKTVSTDSEMPVSVLNYNIKSNEYVNLKPETTYTVFFDYEFIENTLSVYYLQLNCLNGDSNHMLVQFSKNDIDNNLKVKKFVTSGDYEMLIAIFLGATKGSTKFKNNGFMILEGDWTNKEVSYVPFGLNYPQTTEVVECGKNLFDVSKIPTTWNGTRGIKNNGDGTIYLKNSSGDSAVRKVNINKPLASISDTIRDRYYVKDGKKYHEQNVKEIVLKGNEELYLVATTDNVTKAQYRTGVPTIPQGIVCNQLNTIPSGVYSDIEGTAINTVGDIYFSIANSKLETQDINGIKKYIQANNLHFLIALVTPITTEIETEDMQSFDGQTNITTTNTVKPTLDIDIPSDLNAVVSNLMVENSSLKQENQTLSNELENQASSIETQQANVDYISMMTGVDL